MKKYRVTYTMYVEVEADSAKEALYAVAAEVALDEFIFLDEEAEEIEEEEDEMMYARYDGREV